MTGHTTRDGQTPLHAFQLQSLGLLELRDEIEAAFEQFVSSFEPVA